MDFNQFEGMIVIDGNEFNFYYANKYITIFPNDIKQSWNDLHGLYIRNKKKQINFKLLNGTLRIGNSITFIDVSLDYYGRGYYKGYIPAMIISKANNYINFQGTDKVESITFVGGIIDKLYKPKNRLNIDEYDDNIEDFLIRLKQKSSVIKKCKLNDDTLELNIGYTNNYKDLNIPMSLNTYLSIKFNKPKYIYCINEYYEKIFKTLCFIFNRQCVNFQDIILSNQFEVNEKIVQNNGIGFKESIENVQFSLIVNDESEFDCDINDINIDIDILLQNFESLYNIINEEMFPLSYYPKNTYDDTHFDNYQFIKIASAFEGQFDLLYPNYKSNKSKKYNIIKQELLDFILSKSNESNREVRKYLKNFYKIINNCEGSLSEHINYAMQIYQNVISKKKQKLFDNFKLTSISNNDISIAFQNKRNVIAHTSINETFTSIEIIGYVVVKMLVHCLILKRAKFDDDSIINIINSIF